MRLCPVNVICPYRIRHSHYFVLPAFRTFIREQSISIVGPRFWDTVSNDFQNLTSLDLFKRRVSKYVISLYNAEALL